MSKRLAVNWATGIARATDFDSLRADDVRALKSECDVPLLRASPASRASVDDDTRTIRYVWSDETPDRYGDIIRAKGWEFGDYDGNPIALYMHDGERPLGNGVDYAAEGTALLGGIKFAPEGTSEFHDATWKLARAGIIQAVSVGFDPIERVWHDDDDERAALGLGKFGVEFVRQSLLEISLVSIPANPSALQLALRPLIDGGELSDREADTIRAAQITERDWERRARAIRRRSVVVSGGTRSDADRITQLESEVQRLALLLEGKRAVDGAQQRAEAAAAEAQAAAEALERAAEAVAADRLIRKALRGKQ